MPFIVRCIDCRQRAEQSRCPSCQAKRDARRNATSYYQTEHWRRLRTRARRTWGSACILCNSTKRVTFHHLEPRANDDPRPQSVDTVENLRPLCARDHGRYEADKRAGRTTELTRLVEALHGPS